MAAGPENAGVQSEGHNGCDVNTVEGALRGVAVMPSHVRVVKRIACGSEVQSEGFSWMLLSPVVDQAVDRINQAVLWY